MFIIQSGKGLGTRSKITRESGIKTRTSTAHDLNPQKSRALFATPSSSLEDLESTKGKKFCKMTTSSCLMRTIYHFLSQVMVVININILIRGF